MVAFGVLEPALGQRDVAEVEVAGGGQRIAARGAHRLADVGEELPRLGQPLPADQQPPELDQQQRLALGIDVGGGLQRLLDRGFGLLVAPPLLVHVGLDAGQRQQPRRVRARQLDAALELGGVVAQGPHLARQGQEPPQQLELDLRVAAAPGDGLQLLGQRVEQLGRRDPAHVAAGEELEQGLGGALAALE